MRTLSVAAFTCLSLLSACGGSSAGASAPTTELGVAFALPRLLVLGVQSSRTMVAEGVWFATTQTGAGLIGQVTRTGTITVNGSGAAYEPTPTEKLVVRGLPEAHEFEAIQVMGNAQAADAQAWLSQPHHLSYTHRLAGLGELRIDEQFDGVQFRVTIRGHAMIGAQKYDLDLAVRGTTGGNSDSNGRESQTNHTITGSMRSDGTEIVVLEQHVVTFASAMSLRLLHSQRGWASQVRSAIGNSLRSRGAEWRFVDVVVETAAKEKGGQRTDELVSCTGKLVRDDRTIGPIEVRDGIASVTGDATVIPLQIPWAR